MKVLGGYEMRIKFKKGLSVMMAIIMIVSSMGLPVAAAETADPTGVADHIIISQIYGGGGNSGAIFTHDFVELYNPTETAVDLTGWSVQYASSGATALFSGIAPLTGSIQPKDYYLVQLAGLLTGSNLPTPNAIGSINLSGTTGKVALVSNSNGILNSVEPIVNPNVVDFVGFGTATMFEGTVAPAPSNTLSIIRKLVGVDTNNNGADFITSTPNPRNGIPAAVTKCAEVTANVASGVVLPDTNVTFSTSTEGAQIEYNTFSPESAEWTTSSVIKITVDTTVYTRAVKEGLENGDVKTFTYTVNSAAPGTVSEAKNAALNTENIYVKGIVTYFYNRNVYIQDSTGAICLFLTANATKVKVGDEVVALGKRENYGNLIELTNVNETVLKVLSSGNAIPDRGTATLSELKATPIGKTPGFDHMCEIIKITGVTLTSTTLLTQAGITLEINPAVNLADFPGIVAGDMIDATIRMYDNNGTLRAAVTAMSKAENTNQLFLNVSHTSADAISGATLTLTSNDETAKIYYTLDGTNPTEASTLYTGAVKIIGEIGETITLKAFAKAEGKIDSSVLSEAYKIKDPTAVPTIKDVLALPTGTANVEVKGTLAYFATSYSNPVIQQEVDGKTYALYVFGSAPTGAKIGDEVKFIGTYTVRYGQPQITPTSSSLLGAGKAQVAKEMTIAELISSGSTMLGQLVKVKNVKLGTLNTGGSTPVTDATGTINIYKPTPYPVQVVAGDIVDIYAMVAINNTTIQLYTGTKEANGYNIYDVVNDTKPPLLTLRDSYLDAKPTQDYTLAVNAEDNKGIKDVKITYKIGETTVSNQLMAYEPTNNEYRFTIPGSEILASVGSFTFTVTATDVTNLMTTSATKTIVINNLPQFASVTPARNGSTGDNKSPLISVSLNNAGVNPVVKLTLKKDGVTLVDNQDMAIGEPNVTYNYQTGTLVDGTYSATVTVTRADLQSATTTWTFVVGTPVYKAYFGQLHGHTAEYSDGSGTLADGLNYLKSITSSDNVDFVSFTDHSNYFDTTTAANAADAMNDKSLMTATSLEKWNTYVDSMTTFNQENAGSKVAMPGYEMTWSGGPGHINTFNSIGIVSRNNTALNNKTADSGLKAYYETLIKNADQLANLSQFNHPGSTFGTFSDFAYWSPSYDNKMVAVEIGNGEGAIGSGGYFPSYTEYTKALDKGWHVAPTNNQDNHKGRWGNANTARTVIIADEFSTTGMLEGLKNMSVYASEDKNINIDYTVNDLMMGSIISTVPTESLKFIVNVTDPDADDVNAKVEIITNSGRIASSKTFTSNVAEWHFELPSVQGYYYVRVTQADKNIAVTAPIWVGQAPLVGISSFATTTKLPVTNETLSLTTTMFNNETSSVTVKSIEYSIGNQIIKTENLETPLVSTGTYTHSLQYKPVTAGKVVITATATIMIGDQLKTFTQNLDINVRDSEKLVYVGIDASHFNEYVAGNYKDSMGNFANMAVESDVRVVELKTSEELIAATQNPKFKMIILTPPTRRNGNNFLLNYRSYSDAEIAAIKAFSELGNTVIITGWGDYYESYTKFSDGTAHTLPAGEHMSAQQNKLLDALGSSLRVSDDEVKDDVTNEGQAQRLHLKEYNLDNPFLESVKPLEQVYSSYAGSTIYAVGSDKLPTATLPTTISPMVYAFATGYSSDDDQDGTTGIPGVMVPKYSDKYMVIASESITHSTGKTGTVIVAGAAFMSNFEIQVTMDSYATPEYSNYTILENVIRFVNPVVITKIADVQAATEGQTFTIQGVVTSNASGFDKETAFFDCIYVQDETAGINAFPVAGVVKAGQTVEITGVTSSYNGERQIAVEKVTIIDETIKALPAAKVITTAEAAGAMHLGSLVKVSGTITNLVYSNNVIESIFVKDSSGTTCRIFIDGYITQNIVIANLAVGNKVTATGLSSYDTEGARIRIRDRADVVCTVVDDSDDTTPDVPKPGNPNPGNPNPGNPKPNGSVENNENSKVVVSSITITEMTQENGQISAPISKENVNQMIDQLLQADVKGKLSVLEFIADTNATETDVTFVIDRSAFNQIATETDASVKLNTGIGSIQLDRKTVESINSQGGNSDVSISLVKVDPQTLSTEMKNVIGDRPVYDFTISSGDQTITSFGSGKVTVSLPYVLKPGERANSVVIYYVDASGQLQTVRGNYNKTTMMVEFKTSHFSSYMIGYGAVNFKDVKETNWFYESVSYVAARNIAAGTGAEMFSPTQNITRGQFLVMMMNAYGITPDANAQAQANFADAGNTYYTDYLATAKKLGLAGGKGDNLYAPDALITRQDMFTMLYKALEVVNELPELTDVRNASDFSDFNSVASYAKEAMTALVEGGFVSGKNNKLDPNGLATRAEMAQMLYNLLVLE
jgi:hypothetical protein